MISAAKSTGCVLKERVHRGSVTPTTWEDISQYRVAGTVANLSWTKLPNLMQIPTFNGSTSIVTITDHQGIQNIFDGLGGTILAWVNPASAGEDALSRIVDKRSGGQGYRIQIYGLAGGFLKIEFLYDFSTTDGIWRTTAAILPINTFSLFVLTYQANSVANDPIIYIANTALTTYTVGGGITEDSTPVGTRRDDSGQNMVIGNNQANTGCFDGMITYYTSYRKVFTAGQIRRFFDRTKGRFGY